MFQEDVSKAGVKEEIGQWLPDKELGENRSGGQPEKLDHLPAGPQDGEKVDPGRGQDDVLDGRRQPGPHRDHAGVPVVHGMMISAIEMAKSK